MRKNWRNALVLAIVLIVSFSFSAFANGNSEAKTTEKGKTKVTMAVWSGNWKDRLTKAEAEFEKRNPNIDLEIQIQSGDYSNYLGAKTAANDLADIFILTPYSQVKSYAAANRLMDVSDATFVNDVYESSKNAVTYDGKIYGYPANFEFLGVYYNIDLFKKAGINEVPKTRSEFLDACKKLEAAGIQPIASTFKESWTLKHMFSILLSTVVQDDMDGFIASLNSGDGTFNVPGIDNIFAFADIVKQYSGKKYMDCDSTSGFNALANNEAAMLISGEFSLTTLTSVENPPEIGLFALPVSETASDNKLAVDVGIVYAINANPNDKAATLTVLDYLSAKDDPTGFNYCTCDTIGSAPPAMPYEVNFTSPAYEDYAQYANDGNVIPWIYQQFANGFDVVSGEIFQSYVFGAKDEQTVLKELDDAYKSFI